MWKKDGGKTGLRNSIFNSDSSAANYFKEQFEQMSTL